MSINVQPTIEPQLSINNGVRRSNRLKLLAWQRSLVKMVVWVSYDEEVSLQRSSALFVEPDEPQSYKQLMLSENAEHWKQAIEEEYNFLMKKQNLDSSQTTAKSHCPESQMDWKIQTGIPRCCGALESKTYRRRVTAAV